MALCSSGSSSGRSGSGGAGFLRGVGAGATAATIQCCYKEVSGPGPSGVKSHTGSANAATAPSPASRNTCPPIQENTFPPIQRNTFNTCQHQFGPATCCDTSDSTVGKLLPNMPS